MHGTGWAGVPRYVARTRITARINEREAQITALREAQDADLDLLRSLDRDEDGPLVRHRWARRTSTTYNGEDDHVQPSDYIEGPGI